MLAVKLHKRKAPYLGKGSFLIPISTWQSGKVQVRNWLRLLHNIRYMTLVQIPDQHPIYLGVDWVVRIIQGVHFMPLSNIDDEIKEALNVAGPQEKGPLWMQNHRLEWNPGAPKAELPELILSDKLPPASIKWTKDVKLLYHGRKPLGPMKHM